MTETMQTVTLPSRRTVVPGSERRPRATYRATGPADPQQPVRLVLKLRPQAATPRHSSVADVEAVAAFARAHRLRVEEADAAARLMVLTGTARRAAAAFGTRLEIFRSPHGISAYRGRVGAVHMPAELAGIVTAVTGLDERRQVGPRMAAAGLAHRGAVSYSPAELARLYDFPPDLDGSGQCIGLLEFGGGFDRADLDIYFRRLGLPTPEITVVSVDGTPNAPGDPEFDTEVMLDIEVAGAAAPGARIAVYFACFTEAGWLEAITKAVHDGVNRPSVLSISYGQAELEPDGGVAWTRQVVDEVNRTLEEAARRGVTVVVAAGDDGSIGSLAGGGTVHAEFPASSPYVLSCGGTTLRTRDGAIESEVVWSNGVRNGLGHGSTGGGVSDLLPRPAWQEAPELAIPAAAASGFVGRGYPDVAAVADCRTGYQARSGGQDMVQGGTSAAAPLWAALLARINQHLATLPGRPTAGYLTPRLYQGLGASDAFRDIVSGSNDPLGTARGSYTAGTGWDACTGWGSPHGVNLLRALCAAASRTPAPASTPEPASTPAAAAAAS
jgi:kumamolisin